jgi:hypothetical protein
MCADPQKATESSSSLRFGFELQTLTQGNPPPTLRYKLVYFGGVFLDLLRSVESAESGWWFAFVYVCLQLTS